MEGIESFHLRFRVMATLLTWLALPKLGYLPFQVEVPVHHVYDRMTGEQLCGLDRHANRTGKDVFEVTMAVVC